MTQQRSILAGAAAATLLLANGALAAETCTIQGEQPLEFRFFTDNHSWKDNGWVLECDYEDESKELLWEVPIGSLARESHTEVIREAACVPDTATCTLNIFDASGDGLQGAKNELSTQAYSGWFALLHGSTTVATYKNEDPKFTELTYCVGPKCEKKPQEIQADDPDCQETVYLAMQLDNTPEDTSYQLFCGGDADKNVIWDGKGFTQAGAYVEREACLPKDVCCEFLVVDGSSNGLTDAVDLSASDAPDGTQPMGFVYLEKNFEPILTYDGKTGETFGVLSKKFGACEEVEQEPEEDEIVATDGVTVPESDEEEEVAQDQTEQKEEKEDAKGGDDLDVEVGDNLDGVFDPDKEKQTVQIIEELVNQPQGSSSNVDTDNMYWNQYGTYPPTEEDTFYRSDDDYQNFNDDGKGFGKFNDDGNLNWDFGGLDDKIYEPFDPTIEPFGTVTVEPTIFPFGTGTFMPSSLQDDFIWTNNGMEHVEDLIKELDENTVKLPSDPNAAAFLKGENPYETKGLSTGAKVAVGILVPLFVLWTAGVAAYFYKSSGEGPPSEIDSDGMSSAGSVV